MPSPSICQVATSSKRDMGINICDLTARYDYLVVAYSLVLNFLGPADVSINDVPEEFYTSNIQARIAGLRIFVSDPLLGCHLPVAVVCLPSVALNISNLMKNCSKLYHIAVNFHIWAEYFNNTLKCWEPLLEPYCGSALFEESSDRGEGLTIISHSPLHFNISGALLETLDDAVQDYSESLLSMVGMGNTSEETNDYKYSASSFCDYGAEEDGILHENSHPLSMNDRVAFSLMNLTGQVSTSPNCFK